ncbi:substrate-binding periplasmic protein [Inhella gelatinilytica]|uniref:Transporter substrate-binding domain-containing protein n=1 Tax=Inhella gelatinilytica TaxID=2795030 RepID=A0A931IV97_9BURK|nr:transporter substrate-binding domain-containing protein [Inhella gelatinilytica]MBH9552582.1 transporter substrate-binding domain-containing protein [Inhella gelatinilytica]
MTSAAHYLTMEWTYRRTGRGLWLAAAQVLTVLAALAPLSESVAREPNIVVFVAASNHTAPLSRFEEGALVGGLVKDLGDALARRMGLQARYLVLPSKRAPAALRNGEGDLLCYTRPEWIGSDFQFTRPLIPNADVVAARASAAPLSSLLALRQRSVGTVLGYRYAEVEAALGSDFKRDDAPTMEANLNKLAMGRMDYAVTDRLVLREAIRQGQPLREEWVLTRYAAPCALSPRSPLRLATLQTALQALVDSGEWARILAVYGLTP